MELRTRRSSPGTGQGQGQRGRLTLGLERRVWRTLQKMMSINCSRWCGLSGRRGCDPRQLGDQLPATASCSEQPEQRLLPPCARSRVRQKEASGGAGPKTGLRRRAARGGQPPDRRELRPAPQACVPNTGKPTTAGKSRTIPRPRAQAQGRRHAQRARAALRTRAHGRAHSREVVTAVCATTMPK